jgi:hypothetical protein
VRVVLGIARIRRSFYDPLSMRLTSRADRPGCGQAKVTANMSEPFAYAAPLDVDRTDDCFFYHKIDLPGVGEVGGQWDLRSAADDYLGRFDFRGRRVLDVGAASGFLSFEIEKRGGEVVSFDMRDGAQWDVVPHTHLQPHLDEVRANCRAMHRRLQNAYWFSHRRLGSRARAYYGNVYDLPAELGRFDVAFFGMILSHLRDPFQALYSVSRLVSGHLIVTNQLLDFPEAFSRFLPSAENGELVTWWSPSQACLTRMLGVLGFQVQASAACAPQCLVEGRVRPEKCVALVAQRVAGCSLFDAPGKAPAEAA